MIVKDIFYVNLEEVVMLAKVAENTWELYLFHRQEPVMIDTERAEAILKAVEGNQPPVPRVSIEPPNTITIGGWPFNDTPLPMHYLPIKKENTPYGGTE